MLLLAAALVNLCGLGLETGTPGDQEVSAEGVLLIGQHDARLQDRVRPPGSLECSLFVVFPGTPAFLTPGYSWEERRDARVGAFSVAYQREWREKGAQPRRVRIRGTLVRRAGFRWTGPHRANGFGYRGVYPAAILVKSIEFAP